MLNGRKYITAKNWIIEHEVNCVKVANSVDGDHTYETPIDEGTMCKALEYAEENGCRIKIVPDDSCNSRVDGWTYHIEFTLT